MAAVTIERLRLLLSVAANGTIARAAAEVGYTASAVSQQLAGFERELGTTLLERSNRGVSLTRAGERLRARASVILDLVQTATVEATQAGPEVPPIALRIGAFPTAISGLVVPAMALLEPQVELTIVDLEPEQALMELTSRRLDAALIDFYEGLEPLGHEGLHQVHLLTDVLRVVVRRDRRPPDSLTDLRGLPWILGGGRSRLGRATRMALRACGVTPEVLLESDDHWMTFDALQSLDAVAVLPELALRVAPDHVAAATRIDLACDRHIHLVTREVLRPHPGFALLETTLSRLSAEFGEHGPNQTSSARGGSCRTA